MTGIRRLAVLRWLLAIVVTVVALPVLYLAVAHGLMLFPANAETAPYSGADRVSAYVASNGFHAEFVFPTRSATVTWTDLFVPEAPGADADRPAYVAIGWGDREFYLHTPRWRDITPGRALRALAGGNPSLVHVTYVERLAQFDTLHHLPLSVAQYRRLADYVISTLELHAGRPVVLPGAGYGESDAFYRARGAYDAFNTSNAWVGRGLRVAGVLVSPWTPFACNVLWRLEPVRVR